MKFGKLSLSGTQARFSAGVTLTSEQYDLKAGDVLALFEPSTAAKKAQVTKVTATGNAGGKTQVDAHIRQDVSGAGPADAFEVFADKAVYVPDSSRPGGGRIDFTGHVKVISQSAFLAVPSLSTFDDSKPVTVLLGQGENYPQMETGPGQVVATPTP